MRVLAATMCCLAGLSVLAQDQPEQPEQPVQPVQAQAEPDAPERSYETLEPRLRRACFQRAGDYIRTPDGRIWDGWGQRAYHEALKRNTVVVSEGRRESVGVFSIRRETGRRLDVRDGPEAQAWKLRPHLTQHSPCAVPLWFTLEQRKNQPRLPFFYINQLSLLDDMDPLRDRFTKLEADLGGGYLRVRIFPAGERQGDWQTRIVLAPEDLDVKDGYLPGEFILWRAPAIEPPVHINMPPKQSVYRYIPIEDIRLTPEQLVAAILEQKAELVEWDYRRSGSDYVWQRRVQELRFQESRPPQRQQDSSPAAPGKKTERPELAEATHTLRLRDGRVLRGRLISREGGAIAFAAHVASTEVEMRFADSEVEAVDEIQ